MSEQNKIPDFDLEKKRTGVYAGIQIGFACPKCRIFMENPPNPNMPICNDTNKHRLSETIHPVVYIEKHDGEVFIDMAAFGKEQTNVLHAIIRNVNDAWGWILNHDHIQDQNLVDRITQVEDRLAAVESVIDNSPFDLIYRSQEERKEAEREQEEAEKKE